MRFLCVDIGGTKSAVALADEDGRILKKETFETAGPDETVALLIDAAALMLQGESVRRIGISCGSPMDSAKGLILEPPNLPGWKEDLSTMTSEEQFPQTFRDYIQFLEDELQTPITIVSVGPDRAQTIVRSQTTL